MATTTEPAELTLGSVTVEDAGAATKKITIEIPAEVVHDRVESSFGQVSANVRLPGFRAGKAPRSLIERRFGKGLRDEAKQELVRDALSKAIEEKGLRPIGQPIIKDGDKIEIKEGKPLTFTAEMEVVPEFEMPSLEGVDITKPVLEVTDEMVDEELDNQLKRAGRLEDLNDDAKPEAGDLFIGRVEVFNAESDEIVAKTNDAVTRFPGPDDDGAGAVGGLQIEKLDDLLKDKKAGDTLTHKMKGPENHEIEAIRDADIRIEFHIDRVAKLIPAEIEEVTQRYNLESADEFRDQIRDALQRRVEFEQQDAMRRQVAKKLLDDIEFDLPARASAAQAQRILETTRMRLLQRGVPDYMVEEHMAELRSSSEEQANRELKINFVMEKVAETFDVEVTEQEVNMRIAMIARQQNVRPEQLRSQLIQSGRAAMIFNEIRHEKAADMVISKANISEVSADEWNKMMEAEADGKSGGSAAASKKKTTKKKSSSSSASSSKKTSSKKKTTKKKSSSSKKTGKKKSDGGEEE
ncbi:MAG: trigger factor [Phycisphaerales bacterium]